MCGIYGIIANKDIMDDLFMGLYSIQHRGQDACGLLALEKDRIHHVKILGLVEELVKHPEVKKIENARIGIGQVRYPTVGFATLDEAQPFFARDISIGLVHNGNVINLDDERARLCNDLADLKISGSDLEIILGYFRRYKPKSFDDLKKILVEIESRVVGAYSFIGTLKDHLFAYRDSRGIRPLLIARDMNKVVICSESSPLKNAGFKEIGDIIPGTLILVDSDLNIKMKTLFERERTTCFFEWIYFSSIDSVLEKKSAYSVRFGMGRAMAKRYASQLDEVDIVVPVPESSRPAAISAAEVLAKPYREVLVKNRYIQRTFILKYNDRNEALRKKLVCITEEIKGKNILLIDDSIVRGNTAKRIITQLKEAGANKIFFMTICPEIRFPCYYGIDFPDRDELISAQFDRNKLAEVLGVEHVFFPEVTMLGRVIESHELCTACLTANYPTSIQAAEHFLDKRRRERKEGNGKEAKSSAQVISSPGVFRKVSDNRSL